MMANWFTKILANLRKPSDAEIIKRKADEESVAKFHAELEAMRRRKADDVPTVVKPAAKKKSGPTDIPELKLPAPAKKSPAKAVLKEATRDGDGDGIINDGKPNQRKAPAKKSTK